MTKFDWWPGAQSLADYQARMSQEKAMRAMASVMEQVRDAMRAQGNGATGGFKLKSFEDYRDDMTKAAAKHAGAPFADPSLGEQWQGMDALIDPTSFTPPLGQNPLKPADIKVDSSGNIELIGTDEILENLVERLERSLYRP